MTEWLQQLVFVAAARQKARCMFTGRVCGSCREHGLVERIFWDLRERYWMSVTDTRDWLLRLAKA